VQVQHAAGRSAAQGGEKSHGLIGSQVIPRHEYDGKLDSVGLRIALPGASGTPS
jgi:hypothetical protein